MKNIKYPLKLGFALETEHILLGKYCFCGGKFIKILNFMIVWEIIKNTKEIIT